jgi:hypothetical protein
MTLTACAVFEPPEPIGPAAKEQIVAVTASNHLFRFNAGQPQQITLRRPLTGLRAGERLLGIDYRVARGELYALGASGQLYRIDAATAAATAVGAGVALPPGREWGFDFNPTVDRIRVVNDTGVNLRLHPDTGAQVDADPATAGVQGDGMLRYEPSDPSAGKAPSIVAAAYSYNKTDSTITTNFALDGRAGTLVTQGTREGATPAVSPNTGRLMSVGALGTGPFEQAVFDLSDLAPVAYAGIGAGRRTRWFSIDLTTGKARFIGTVGGGEPLVGAATEP